MSQYQAMCSNCGSVEHQINSCPHPIMSGTITQPRMRRRTFHFPAWPAPPTFTEYQTASLLIVDLFRYGEAAQAWSRGFQAFAIQSNEFIRMGIEPSIFLHPHGFSVEFELLDTEEHAQCLQNAISRADRIMNASNHIQNSSVQTPARAPARSPSIATFDHSPERGFSVKEEQSATGSAAAEGNVEMTFHDPDERSKITTPTPSSKKTGHSKATSNSGAVTISGKITKAKKTTTTTRKPFVTAGEASITPTTKKGAPKKKAVSEVPKSVASGEVAATTTPRKRAPKKKTAVSKSDKVGEDMARESAGTTTGIAAETMSDPKGNASRNGRSITGETKSDVVAPAFTTKAVGEINIGEDSASSSDTTVEKMLDTSAMASIPSTAGENYGRIAGAATDKTFDAPTQSISGVTNGDPSGTAGGTTAEIPDAPATASILNAPTKLSSTMQPENELGATLIANMGADLAKTIVEAGHDDKV